MMPPLPGQGLGYIWSKLSQAQREHVLKSVAKIEADRFKLYCDTLRDAVGLPEAPPAVALAMYRQPTYQWEVLQIRYPQAYKREADRYQKLEEKAAADPEFEAKVRAEMFVMLPPAPPEAPPPMVEAQV